ncbi:polysaccharide pyruvyl transferase family protein [Pseudomonas sp. MM211]|uniref:polysaccharide pyruvyl transferase family protein n=1 Tax=Pseudomonas sp. MM211 TaxID=2866808 RepID=UPI001CED122D|nr:polysaccharide pyruvyl transferase family protein [Pseudomonas sp. MM211]UCJ17310.1 polysaccharide pyruvyl transferase family protein [Pseudomonas sp. MM211]
MSVAQVRLKALLFNDTSSENHHGCQLVMRQIFTLAGQVGMDIQRSCPMHHDWQTDIDLQRDIRAADLCLVNGEGTMHDDAPLALRYGALARYCQEHDIPCFLINSVWQNNDQLNADAHCFTKLFVRDTMSKAALADVGVSAEVVPDLTLSYQHTASNSLRHGMLVNGSVIDERLLEAWRTVKDRQDLRYVSIRTLAPLQLGKGFDFYLRKNLRKRLKALRRIAASYFYSYPAHLPAPLIDRLRWRYAVLSTHRFLNLLGRSRGVITGRFHLVTLCLVTGTPFFALPSNTHKIEALLAQVGLAERLKPSYEQAVNAADRIAFSESELTSIGSFLQETRMQAEAMFREMAQIARAANTPDQR